MEDTAVKGLAELVPEGLGAEGSGWQQRKSAQTRVAIMRAAITCLEEQGYARTTTQLIARVAEISRGAMLHHYATKQELIGSVIDYTMYRRMEQFVDGIRGLSEAQRIDQLAGIELYWQSLLTPEFTAYVELLLAARTDPELGEIFYPKARAYDRVERSVVLRAFPEWGNKTAEFDLAMDFCIASMEGLLLNRTIWDNLKRRQLLRGFVSQVIRMLREGRLVPEDLAAD